MLPTRTINKAGAYQVRLCHNGEWRTLLLDDCFPCVQSNQAGVGVPAFAFGARRQLWVALIEKVSPQYASLHGRTPPYAPPPLSTPVHPCPPLFTPVHPFSPLSTPLPPPSTPFHPL